MHLVGFTIMTVGGIIAIIGQLMLLSQAFRKSVGWFACCLFVPLLFLALHWRQGKKPFLITIVGIAILFFGVYVHDGFSITSTVD